MRLECADFESVEDLRNRSELTARERLENLTEGRFCEERKEMDSLGKNKLFEREQRIREKWDTSRNMSSPVEAE